MDFLSPTSRNTPSRTPGAALEVYSPQTAQKKQVLVGPPILRSAHPIPKSGQHLGSPPPKAMEWPQLAIWVTIHTCHLVGRVGGGFANSGNV